MGFLSSLFGGDLKRTPRSGPEEQLFNQSQSLVGEAEQQHTVAKQYLKDIGDTTREEAQARGTSNADVMQRTTGGEYDPTHPGLTSLGRAVTRTRALARMGWAGADSAKGQAFQQRMQASKFGSQLRNGQALSALGDIAAANQASQNLVSNIGAAGTANAVGTLAGAGAAAYSNYKYNQTQAMKPPSGWKYEGRLPSEVGKP